MSRELEHIWSRVQAQLVLTVDEPTYRIWLEPLRAVELDGKRLVIDAPSPASRWVQDRFGRILQASVELILGAGATIELSGGGGEPPSTPRPPDTSAAGLPPAGPGPLGNPKLTFDQFVIGDCNRLAHAAALTVAEMPAQAYNPLFLCGPPGVGKTHLLSSIANLLTLHNPDLAVRCTTGEAFTNEFIASLGGGRTDAFKLRFRDIDVLLVDDVQFLERKARTEEEFFHTFNALNDAGRQIVVTCDRPPSDLLALEDRLRERFESGLVADVKPPDRATRSTILRKRVQHDRIHLEDELALEAIAERVRSNVRALEGALIRVVAYSSLTGRPLTAELVEEVLDGLYPAGDSPGQRNRSIGEIQAAACRRFHVTSDELLSRARSPRVAWPRQLAMYLARELTEESLPTIGREFGGRDHTTVLHAWRRTSTRLASEDDVRETVNELCRDLDIEAP